MKPILINDLLLEDIPSGGVEHVDDTVAKVLDLDRVRSDDMTSFDQNAMYVVSNIARFTREKIEQLIKCNYIIIEHGYQFLNKPRRVCRFKDFIVPRELRINYDLYAKAKAVFVQTTEHLNMFNINDVKANFINLKSSLWSNADLDLLDELRKTDLKPVYSIYKSINGIKNTRGAIQYCNDNNLPYELIGNKNTRREFLECLSRNKSLVFLPTPHNETFSRLVVEARCMGIEVITTKTYGAVLEDWYDMYEGKELVDFLRKNTTANLDKIREYLYS